MATKAKTKKERSKQKLKTHRGAAKRFKVNAAGKVKYKAAGKRHLLSKKSSKKKRQQTMRMLNNIDGGLIKKLMPYA